MKYTSKLILNGETYQFAAPGGGGGWQPGVNTIAYYNINDNDDNTAIYDLSGNGNDLAWYGTPDYVTDSTYGRCANFDNGAYTSLGGYVNPNGDNYTIICLFNGIYDKFLIGQGSSSSYLNTIALGSNGAFTCQRPADVNNYVDPNTSVIPYEWHLLCGVRDGLDFYLYLDGQFENSKSFGSVYVDWTDGGYWGMAANRQQYDKYTGMIKMVIFENKSWTQAEVEALAQEYGFTI